MRVCIVGAGWYGCHAARVLLSHNIDIKIIDRTGFFSGSSSKNQNRLHLGYHYPRSPDTVAECTKGYVRFCEEYGFCVREIPQNVYLIHDNSKVSFDAYQELYVGHRLCTVSEVGDLRYVGSQAMLVDERYIDNSAAKQFFERTLGDRFECREAGPDIDEYDYVLNCTNNTWVPFPLPVDPTYECFCTLLYRIQFSEVKAFTVMDGGFFSIFPYDMDNNIYTVTHVVHGVRYRGSDPTGCDLFDINDLRDRIESDVCTVFPAFRDIAVYTGHFLSGKTKYDYTQDDRHMRYFRSGKYLSFSGGKITGIFEMEKILEEICRCCQMGPPHCTSQVTPGPSNSKETEQSTDSPTMDPALGMTPEHDRPRQMNQTASHSPAP
jgi:hypothetical protein